MADFNVGDMLRVACVWRFGGSDEQVNVLHLHIGSTVAALTADVLDDVGEYLLEAYNGMVGAVCTGVLHDRYEVQNLNRGLTFGASPAIPGINGAAASDCLAPQSTALLLMNTTIPRVQGRLYLPTFGEGDNGNGFIGAPSLGGMASLGDYLLAEQTLSNGTALRYCVFRNLAFFTFPYSYRAVPTLRVQRRRQLGRGS